MSSGRLLSVWVVVVVMVICHPTPLGVHAQGADVISMSQGYRLPNNVQYLALAPRKVHPEQTFQVHITLFSMPYTRLTLRVILSQDNHEYSSTSKDFDRTGTHQLQLKVPIYVTKGKHQLSIEGLVGSENAVFRNVTELRFDSKYVSLFIQTDRPVYYSSSVPGDTGFKVRDRKSRVRRGNFDEWDGNYEWPAIDEVKFRIVGTTPSLVPISGPITIYIKDGQKNVIRRYLQRQLNFGIYEDSFKIAYPCKTGDWSIMVEAFNHVYEQEFLVEYWFPRRFEVNVTTPIYMFNTEWGIAGSLTAKYLSGADVYGNGTINLRVRGKDGKFLDGEMEQTIGYLDGETQFSFSLSTITEEFGDVTGMDLCFKAYVYDFYWWETQNGTSVSSVVEDGIKLKVLGPKFRTFKPRVPFTIYFAVTRSDGTPYQGFLNRQIIVNTVHRGGGGSSQTRPEVKMLVPDDSIVRFEVFPGENDRRIQIRAWHPVTGSGVDIDCYRYWSPTNRYMSVTTSTQLPKVDEYVIFTIRTNFFVPEVNYMIMAQGNVLLGSMVIMRSQQKTFSVAVSRHMAPKARLLVYAVVDEEILVDSLNFFVQDTRLTKASIEINKGKDFVGDTVEILGRGVPGAFLSITGHDYEFYRRGAQTFFNQERIIRELMTYDDPNEGPYQYSWYYNDERWEETVFFTSPTAGVDHLTTFNVSGLAALSDMNLTATPESHRCNATLGYGRCLSGQCYELRYLCDGKVDCTEDAFDELNCPATVLSPRRKPALKDLHYTSRHFFTNQWLWHTTYIKYTGQIEWKTKVPENFGTYTAGAFVLDREEGLSIAPKPIHHDARRVFYMIADCPRVQKRGEQLGITLSLFNEWDEDLEVIVRLHGGENYRFIHVEDYGWVNSYSPRMSAGDVQTMVELQAGESKIIHMPVVPIIESGEYTVTLSAYCFLRKDTESITISVVYDGVENDDQIPYLVDLVNQGSVIIPDFDIPIPERFFVPNQRELLYIPGSNVATVFVYGDVVGPGFFEKALNVGNTAGVPPDSTDAYVYDLAINLQTLKYLQIVNALTRKDSQGAIEYMKFMLQRLYSNRQDDGSYNMFARSTKPGLWVSAFATQTLHDIAASEWNEEIYIEMHLINQGALWITEQQEPNGMFKETSDFFYLRAFWPNSTDSSGTLHTDWHIPVTAYVTIALASATRLTGAAKTASDTAKQKAADYLSTKLTQITDPLQMAMMAYALHMTNHRTRDDAFSALKRMARKSEYLYWADQEITPNPTKIINTVHYMQPRDDYINMGYANMATSYGLMLYLAHNEFDAARPIMKWLNTQHNDLLTWSSTQDTLLVLKALTDYAFRETNRDIYQMEIILEATKDPSWRKTVMLNKTNFAQLHEFELPGAWGQVKASAKGTGYAFIHVSAFHHVENEYQVGGPDYKAISFELENMAYSGRNASVMTVEACMRWQRPDIAPVSGQAWFEFNVPTGYTVTRDTINYMYNQNVPGLKYAEYREETLFMSFAYISQTKHCVKFMLDRWYPVANISIAHVIWTFEYGETGLQLQTMYETYTLFHNHICQVCGSFQCPYCPYFNAAPPRLVAPSPGLFVLTVAMVLYQSLLSLRLHSWRTYLTGQS